MEETKYCLCCGDEVRFNRIERNERIEMTCEYCGFLLSFEDDSMLTMQAPTSSTWSDRMQRILVADDSKFTRKIIRDLLVERNIADEIMTFENGLELT